MAQTSAEARVLVRNAGAYGQRGMYIPALDGVRGFAVLLVLAFHFVGGARAFLYIGYKASYLTAFGWVGVDLFFVLSGFLITGILYDARGREKYFRNFYARRAFRIFPLYYLVAILTLFVLPLWWPMDGDTLAGALYVLTFTSNLNIAANGWLANPQMLAHYWTLSVEEQFYLVWPVAVLYLSRSSLMALCVVLSVVVLCARAMLVAIGTDPVTIFVFTALRVDALAIGSFCALMVRGPDGARRGEFVGKILFVLGILGTIGATLYARSFSEYAPILQSFGFSTIAVSAAGIILLCLSENPIQTVMSHSVLRWLGQRSYGIYVWHYPVYMIFIERPELAAWLEIGSKLGTIAYVCSAIGLTLLVAMLSFRYFEQPFLRLKAQFA